MKAQRRIISSVGLVAVAAACLPAGAQANPLLSGYGGPGQGNQAILGATLLNGRGGGGGSGTLAAASSSGSLSGESASGTAAPQAHKSSGGGSSRGHAGAQRQAPAPRRPPDLESSYRALERSANVSGDGALGLSGSEVALIGVVLALLALIGTVTWRVARPRPAKGHG
jgi:hypothetical protein